MCVNWEKYGKVGNKNWLKAKNVDSWGKILIRGEKIWSKVEVPTTWKKASCEVYEECEYEIWMWGEKIWKGGKHMGNLVKYWMC